GVIVAVDAVAGHPVVGARGGGEEAVRRRVGAVAVDRDHLDIERAAGRHRSHQREGDRAGGVEAARQGGRVGQPGAAAQHYGRAGRGGDGWLGRVHHLRLVVGGAGGRGVGGVAGGAGHPIEEARG